MCSIMVIGSCNNFTKKNGEFDVNLLLLVYTYENLNTFDYPTMDGNLQNNYGKEECIKHKLSMDK